MSPLVGLPLELALERLADQGLFPQVVYTRSPRHPVTGGEARVLRVQADGSLLAAVFPPPAGEERRD